MLCLMHLIHHVIHKKKKKKEKRKKKEIYWSKDFFAKHSTYDKNRS